MSYFWTFFTIVSLFNFILGLYGFYNSAECTRLGEAWERFDRQMNSLIGFDWDVKAFVSASILLIAGLILWTIWDRGN